MLSDIIRPEALFTCKKCGDCCKGYGGTYVSEKDICAIAAYIGTDANTVIHQYCVPSGNKQVLAQRQDGYCIFWDQLCTIHPVKPKMCRQWPFIRSLKADIHNWHSMAASCPGMRTDFDLNQLKEWIESFIEM